MVDLVGDAGRAAAGRARRAARACARSTTSARRRSGSTRSRSSTTASAARPRATSSRSSMETEGLDFKSRAGVPRRPLRGRARARGGGPGGGGAARAPRAAATRCSSARRRTTCACCGSRPRRGTRATYLAGRGLEERVLREFRVGYAPSAWDKVMVASMRAGFTEAELLAAGLGQRSQAGLGLRPLPRADHVPAGRRARARARVRGARDGRRTRAEVPQHVRRRDLPQGPPALRGRPGARAGREGGRA